MPSNLSSWSGVAGLLNLAIAVHRISSSSRQADDVPPQGNGDIEAHAHTICLIYRPKDEQGRWSGLDEIIVAKQRPIGHLGLGEAQSAKSRARRNRSGALHNF